MKELSEQLHIAPEIQDGEESFIFGAAVVEMALRASELTVAYGEANPRTQEAAEELGESLNVVRKELARWSDAKSGSDESTELRGIVAAFRRNDAAALPFMLRQYHSYPDGKFLADPRRQGSHNLYPESRSYELCKWLGSLDDLRLTNFLQWNHARSEAADEALRQRRPEIEEQMRYYTRKLVERGAAPAHAIEAMERAFQETKTLRTADAFEAGAREAAGLYKGALGHLAVAREFDLTTIEKYIEDNHEVLFHEFLHGLGFANKMDLIYLLDEDEEPLTWLNEALVQHLTLVALHSDADTTDPDERSDAGTYVANRKLMDLILHGGDADISFYELVAANFEQRSGLRTARQHLDMRLKASFQERFPDIPAGENILHVIAREYNEAPRRQRAGVLQKWIDKITFTLSEWEAVTDSTVTAFADEVAQGEAGRPEISEDAVEEYLDKHYLV